MIIIPNQNHLDNLLMQLIENRLQYTLTRHKIYVTTLCVIFTLILLLYFHQVNGYFKKDAKINSLYNQFLRTLIANRQSQGLMDEDKVNYKYESIEFISNITSSSYEGKWEFQNPNQTNNYFYNKDGVSTINFYTPKKYAQSISQVNKSS